jgi:hypothetical protein
MTNNNHLNLISLRVSLTMYAKPKMSLFLATNTFSIHLIRFMKRVLTHKFCSMRKLVTLTMLNMTLINRGFSGIVMSESQSD